MSHTSTKVSTGAKLAARKIRGGRFRGMNVLAHMNTAKWNSMNTAAWQRGSNTVSVSGRAFEFRALACGVGV